MNRHLHRTGRSDIILFPEVIGLKKKKEMIPYEKLSKKARREMDRRSRRDWGGMNPVTRRPESSKAYNRSKEKARSLEDENRLRVFVF